MNKEILQSLSKYRVYEGVLLLIVIGLGVYSFSIKQNALEYTDKSAQTIVNSTLTIQTKTKENIFLQKSIDENKRVIEVNKKKLEQFNLFYKD